MVSCDRTLIVSAPLLEPVTNAVPGWLQGAGSLLRTHAQVKQKSEKFQTSIGLQIRLPNGLAPRRDRASLSRAL